MGSITGKGILKATISAKVTRLDGTVEDLGVIASCDYTKKSLWKRLLEGVKRYGGRS